MAGQDEHSRDRAPGLLRPGALSALLQELAAAPRPLGEASDVGLRSGDVIGRFELIRELGRGGFGVVWEARDRELDRRVAFKLVRPGEQRDLREERLLREAEAAARLSHPNIVSIFDVGRSEHGPYLVLELLQGKTLEKSLVQGALPVREVLRIAVELAKGLAHAHAQGVVHRDLKPGNVFLCEDRQVKVLDFGMAYAFGRRKVQGGTPAYMAPEQCEGAPEDERTDVFALGVILYEMLTGKLPFPDADMARRTWPRPPKPEVPSLPALGNLVVRMLHKDPVKRPRDGGVALDAVTALRKELERTLPVGRAPQRRRRSVSVPRRPRGSMAVLPFVNMSADPEQEHFSDGLTEEILNSLARVKGLRVPGRTSSFFFKRKRVKLADIGRALDVSAVLEGSVRKSGDRVRITARLVKSSDGYHLWSETYDRQLTDIFAVQDDIARAVVAALKLRLQPAKARSTRRSADPEAYNRYLLGQQLFNRLTHADDLGAVAAYQKALDLEPTYAPAWAGLANATYRVADFAKTPAAISEGFTRALAAAERAIALDPDLVHAYVVRGHLRARIQWDWRGARADFERALQLNPRDPDAHRDYARLLALLGVPDDALAHARQAVEIDPLSPRAWSSLGVLYISLGDLGQGKTALNRSLEIAPEQDYASANLGITLLLEGHASEALGAFNRSTAEMFRLMGAALATHDMGEVIESRRALDAFITACANHAAYQVASVYAWQGDIDGAFAWLDRAWTQRDTGLPDITVQPLFRKVRSDPRYDALLRKLNLPAS